MRHKEPAKILKQKLVMSDFMTGYDYYQITLKIPVDEPGQKMAIVAEVYKATELEKWAEEQGIAIKRASSAKEDKKEEKLDLGRVVERYAPLVSQIADLLASRFPKEVQYDDLVQSGLIGLMEAARKWDDSKRGSFEVYAGNMVRNAMMEGARGGEWQPRSIDRKTRKIAAAIKVIEERTGKDAKDREIAEELDIDLDTYYSILQDAAGTRLFSFEEVLAAEDLENDLAPGESPDPSEGLQGQDFKKHLSRAIDSLPEREKMVLFMRYDEEMDLEQIGEAIGVSESRVSQIHSQAAMRLRARLSDWQ